MATRTSAKLGDLRGAIAGARAMLLGTIVAIALTLSTPLKADHGNGSWRVTPPREHTQRHVGAMPRALLPSPGLTRVQSRDIGANAAASAVRSATGGKVLRVQRMVQGTSVIYLVKVLLPGGKVRTVSVDGASGALR